MITSHARGLTWTVGHVVKRRKVHVRSQKWVATGSVVSDVSVRLVAEVDEALPLRLK